MGAKFNLECDDCSDFYVSCWQKNRAAAAFPLLCVRTILFLACLGITLMSAILNGIWFEFGYWFIFLTHWGLIMITVTSGFSLLVSCKCKAYRFEISESTVKLPWFVKAYWVLYNITIPLAIFITIYYYLFLDGIGGEYVIDIVLDFLIHAVNSVLMLVLLFTSRHPSRMAHFFHPLCFVLVYLAFTAIYYAAGGTDPFGNNFIYPTLDWAFGWVTFGLAMTSGVALILVHLLTVGFTAFRNWLIGQPHSDSLTLPVSNFSN